MVVLLIEDGRPTAEVAEVSRRGGPANLEVARVEYMREMWNFTSAFRRLLGMRNEHVVHLA